MLVIGKSNCAGCNMTIKMLEEFKIPFEYSSVESDGAAVDLCKSLGYTTLPVVFVSDEEHWFGFRPDLLRALK